MRSRTLAGRWVRWIVGVLATVNATAQAGAPLSLSITSDRLEMDDQNQIATFTGHVLADDGRMRLTANRMTVRYDKKAKNHAGIRDVKAEGEVVIQQDRDRGTADVVFYQFDKRTLELMGQNSDAVVRRGGDQLSGKRILVTLDEEQKISKVQVQGGENRPVTARITPSGIMQRMENPLREEDPTRVNRKETVQTPPASPPAVERTDPTGDSPAVRTPGQNSPTLTLREETQVRAPVASPPESDVAAQPGNERGAIPTPKPRRRTTSAIGGRR
ncbi:MAG: hypothetical protein G8237_03520 [Magnetococcales bacterium]|nr:hypothetical protein [Magnetococcales bacterium]NGZ05403.1 hypothetical protein [Magnetococcales bacterium]